MALFTPVLLGATGLSIDIGYWYQQQESLQSAVDAGAMAVGNTIAYDYSNLTTTQAVSFAVAAANNATANQFNLTSTSVTVTVNTASTPNKWTVTATIPRTDFFTNATSGVGLLGLNVGNQTASASIDVLIPTTGACLITTAPSGSTIYTQGSGSEIDGTNCGLYADSSSSCAVESYGGLIMGTTVTTNGPEPQSCAQGTGQYVGVAATSPPTPSVSGVTVVSNKPATDPEAGMDPLSTSSYSDLTWPTMPTAPGPPTPALTSGTFNNIQNNGNPPSVPYNLPGGFKYNNLTNLNGSTMSIGTSSSSPNTTTTEVIGGISFTGSGFSSTVSIYGYEFYLAGGGLELGFSSNNQTFSTIPGSAPSGAAADPNNPSQLSTYIFNGETNFSQNGSYANIKFGQGRYFFENSGGTALQLGNSQTDSFANGTDAYFNGSFNPATSGANNNNITFGSGLYIFSSAFQNASGSTTFTGGTYYFYGGLSFYNSTTTVTFGPGIYYIENGELNLSQAQSIIANGATFVLEGTAYYNFSESTPNGLVLAAPTSSTSNCVPLSSFPESSYQTTSPYDGTNGQGICNVLIYQDRNDTQQDQMTAGTAISLTGIIYQPNAPLNLSGGSSQIGPTSTTNANGTISYNLFEIVAKSVNDGGAQLVLSAGASSTNSGSGSQVSRPTALLVQ